MYFMPKCLLEKGHSVLYVAINVIVSKLLILNAMVDCILVFSNVFVSCATPRGCLFI